MAERGLNKGHVRRVRRCGQPFPLTNGCLLWEHLGHGMVVFGKTIITVW